MKDSFNPHLFHVFTLRTVALSFLFVFQLLFLNHKPIQAQIPLTLDSCLKAILARHPLARQAKIKLERAAFLEHQIPISSLPNVLATIRTHNSWGLFIDPTTNELVRDRNFGTSSELEIDFPIFQGLSARFQREVRQWELTAAQWEIIRIERDILIDLIPVFYDALLNQELSILNAQASDSLANLIKRFEKAREQGFYTKREVLQLKVQQSFHETEKQVALVRLESFRSVLNTWMDQPEGHPLIIKTENLPPLPLIPENSMFVHPALEGLKQEIGRQQALFRLSKSGLSPKLEVYANLGTKTSTLKEGGFAWQANSNQNERIGLRLSYPLSSLWTARSESKLASFDLQITQSELELRKQELQIEWNNQVRDFKSLLLGKTALLTQIELLQEEYRYSKALFEEGQINATEYIQSFSRLLKSRADLLRIESELGREYQTIKINLERNQ